MNRSTVLIAAVLLLGVAYWLGSHHGQAQDPALAKSSKDVDKRVLTTSGQASLRVKPDSARVFFRVENYGQQVRESRQENARRVKKVMEALGALKIENLKMKSTNMIVNPVVHHYRPEEMKLPTVLGYHVVNSFTVLVENEDAVKLAELAGKVLDSALESGATGVEQIVFFKRNVDMVRRQALTKAVEEAMANARALAQGADEKIAQSITISGEPRVLYGGRMQNTLQQVAFNPGGGGDTPLVAGDLEITCNVNITCRY
jgi:uncharacterized protein YggE